MIHILYTRFSKALPQSVYQAYFEAMPEPLQQQNLKYLRWQDRHAHLFGKILLQEVLQKFGLDNTCLQGLEYNEYNRPYIPGDIDFNISHAGEYVICAAGSEVRLGIDIERIDQIDFSDFENVMTEQQWHMIKSSSNPAKSFFTYWTIKESVIKADSRGLSIPLKDIHIQNNTVYYDNQTWYLKELVLDHEYCVCLSAGKEGQGISIQGRNYYEEDGG